MLLTDTSRLCAIFVVLAYKVEFSSKYAASKSWPLSHEWNDKIQTAWHGVKAKKTTVSFSISKNR